MDTYKLLKYIVKKESDIKLKQKRKSSVNTSEDKRDEFRFRFSTLSDSSVAASCIERNIAS